MSGMRDYRKKQLKNRGVTMVELIVSFALLAIFLGAATMCISHSVIFFFSEKQTMSAYSVADIVLSEIKNEIRTMQSSTDGGHGYIKIRDRNLTGNFSVVGADASGNYNGSVIEYVTSSINNGSNAVQIDTAGCTAALIDKDGVKKNAIDNIEPNYLTLRYYNQYKEKKLNSCKDMYMDKIVTGSSAEESGNYTGIAGGNVVWHATEKLPVELYQGYTVSLEFSVKPELPDAEGNRIVKYVDVTVIVNNSEGMVYQKERRVALENTVYYNSGNTMYSDVITP